ncbi:MAG: RluA family pseudouridine synthase [Bacilli bacterium]|jgi:23S rRNA pseudouridine1911/1915/1917 synthase
MIKNYVVSAEESSLRIDKYLTLKESKYSRAHFSNLIKEEKVLVNDKVISPSYKIKPNDKISVDFVEEKLDETIKPYNFKLDILYEDDDIIVINKPKGLVVHPGDGHHDDTLVNALVYEHKELSNLNGLERVGIVHRIDKDTSGLLLVCKNNFAHAFIAKQLKDHTMHREYYALVLGRIEEDDGKIIGPICRSKENRKKMAVDPINGKPSVTHFTVVKRYEKYTLLDCRLETGRTHQIRVHMEFIHHPVIGDPLYGKNNCGIYNNGQLLHAYRLSFIHPTTKKEMSFTSPLPQYFTDVLNKLK